VLRIAKGNYTTLQSFKAHVIVTRAFNRGRTIAEVPEFGQEYTWTLSSAEGEDAQGQVLHHFATRKIRYVDTNFYRVRLPKKNLAYDKSYFFIDGRGTLYDGQGQPIWFIPLADSNVLLGDGLRDLKFSPAHTITYLYKNQPHEITWAGEALWNAPTQNFASNQTPEAFHHEFSRLANGHYMVAADEVAPAKETNSGTIHYGTVLEYDADGKQIWKWRSAPIYGGTNYPYERLPLEPYDVHLNAFCFDAKHKYLYVGFKNVSQVIKVKYPEGTVEKVLGRNFEKGDSSLFYQQHSITLAGNGHLCIFDNHNPNNQQINFDPGVLVIDENTGAKIWEFRYPKSKRKSLVQQRILTTGGNASPLAGGNYFVNICSPYSGLLIVNNNHNIIWEAISEEYDNKLHQWNPRSPYRAAFTENSELIEQAIWYKK
jgi:hypothetical protein